MPKGVRIALIIFFTIIHKLNNEGAYFGEVFMQKQQLGTFNLKYEKGIP